MKKTWTILITFSLIFAFFGCGQQPVEVIDLNKVLDIMNVTLDELKDTSITGVDVDTNTIQAIDYENQKPQYNEMFTQSFSKNLNNAKLISKPIGVGLLNDGSIEGFFDMNQNLLKDRGEKQIFTIEIDSERNRLIATDTQNQYRRSSHFRPSGLFMGYFLGSMLGRQRGAGITSSRFKNMKISSKNYHKAAVTKANRSARSRGSSRSFRTGK